MENLEYIEDKSYRVAEPLLQGIKDMLKSLGMDSGHVDRWESLIYLVLILLLSLVITWLLRIVLHRVFVRLSRHTRNKTLQIMIKRRLFSSVAYIFFPLIVLAFLPWVYGDAPHLIRWIERICSIVFVGVFWFYINRTIDTFWHIFSQRDEWRDRPLKGIVQLLKGIFIGVAVILIAAIIAGVSPLKLITGLGAFAAVLMLVFKDSILGFVAGFQLAENDLVRRGDWIVLPGGMVNGVVEDITLDTVKVRNFDHTLISLPPYTLVSSTMQNWRGMTESGGRRIKRAFLIENDSVTACTDEKLEAYADLPYMKDYIAAKKKQREEGRVENTHNSEGLANGTIDTNLGLFRAYVNMYLLHHQSITSQFEVMARLLEPTENGTPFEIYCFTTVTAWVDFESVQSEIVKHILVAASRFDLRIYQNASGYDYVLQAEISSGRQIPS